MRRSTAVALCALSCLMSAPVAAPAAEVQASKPISRVEAKRLSFTLTPPQFAFWDNGPWRIEPGEIELMVGSSSADIRPRHSIQVTSAGTSMEPSAAIITPSSKERVP